MGTEVEAEGKFQHGNEEKKFRPVTIIYHDEKKKTS